MHNAQDGECDSPHRELPSGNIPAIVTGVRSPDENADITQLGGGGGCVCMSRGSHFRDGNSDASVNSKALPGARCCVKRLKNGRETAGITETTCVRGMGVGGKECPQRHAYKSVLLSDVFKCVHVSRQLKHLHLIIASCVVHGKAGTGLVAPRRGAALRHLALSCHRTRGPGVRAVPGEADLRGV